MNNKTHILRAGTAALLGLAFAGSAMCVLARGLGLDVGGMMVYIAALAGALLAGLCTWTGTVAMIAAALLALGFGGIVLVFPGGLSSIGDLLGNWRGMEVDAARLATGKSLMVVLGAYGLGALFAGLSSRREFVLFSVLAYVALIVVGYSMLEDMSLLMALPGLIAAVVALALSGSAVRDGGGLRVLIPAVMVVMLAFLLTPGERLTWEPFENTANYVRGVFEQYFNFSKERIAFSINEAGYDHAGRLGEDVVAMLGGPADPDTTPVMTVTTDKDLLLRGTIRTTYTGYSWVDDTVKNRYLYYDVTHSRVRDQVFGENFEADASAFEKVSAQIEFLDAGTSTLFVPGRLTDFSMPFENAVYYNSAGEMFMAREVQAGDQYAMEGLNPVCSDALAQMVLRASENRDDRYSEILSDYTALPAGIDSAVYTLAIHLTQDYTNPYDKAIAIQEYLLSHCRYTLETDYPPENRDFVSYFLLDAKEGYCSYFATAMAVMGRIAGLPTRYVEGYLARGKAGETIMLTGEDAHAWVEIYFKGLGWISFDPSGGQTSDGEADGETENEDTPSDIPADEPTPSPSPTPSPEDELLGDFAMEPEITPTVPPQDPSESETPDENSFGEGENEENPFEEDAPWQENQRAFGWLWGILIGLLVLLIGVLMAYIVKKRLKKADPIYLSGQTRDGRQAAMILYRANLTLLAHMGQGPLNGESPEVFARRIAAQFEGTDFERFVDGVTMGCYANQPIGSETIMAGRRAYSAFMAAMRPVEKMRFALTRIFRGLGNFESIP